MSQVTNMADMFRNACSFNQDIGNWDVSQATNMADMFHNACSFNQDLGNWEFGESAHLLGMLDNSGLDCDNYSASLIGWAANPATPSGRSLGATALQYGNNAVAARDSLINIHGWTITGDSASGVDCPASPLSVELLDFYGKKVNKGAELYWHTATEVDSDYFEVEKSANGQEFTPIGKVNAMGNTTSVTAYHFRHENPTSGVNYYRLRQVDTDGSYSYSDVVNLHFDRDNKPLITPNPASTFIRVIGLSDSILDYRITNIDGRLLYKGQCYTNEEIVINHLPEGAYQIWLDDGKQQWQILFVKY